MLLGSYQRRKQWEAEVQALALLKWLAEAVGGGKSGKGHSARNGRQYVSGAALMTMAGKEI